MSQLVSFLFVLLLAVPASALMVDSPLSDPALEERAKLLFIDIRCMVCNSETIADSNAKVAADMRRDIRGKIQSGVSAEAIKADLSTQYGDVILMNPPLKISTILLWFGPWLVLFIGAIVTYFYFRSSQLKKKS